MCTYVKLPRKLPPKDPDWMIKRFRGEPLQAEEIEDYMKWKHEFKLSRFKLILKGVHTGTLVKVHQETTKRKVECEVGAGCEGWNKEVYDGIIFGRCRHQDPFYIWNKHVKMKDYEDSLNIFMELFDFAVFEQPKG